MQGLVQTKSKSDDLVFYKDIEKKENHQKSQTPAENFAEQIEKKQE